MNKELVKRIGADKRNWRRLAQAVDSQGRALIGSQADLIAAHNAPVGEVTEAMREVATSHGMGLEVAEGKYYLTLPEYANAGR